MPEHEPRGSAANREQGRASIRPYGDRQWMAEPTSPDEIERRLLDGIVTYQDAAGYVSPDFTATVALMREAASLIKTLREAVETEREECAKLAASMYEQDPTIAVSGDVMGMKVRDSMELAGVNIASAIRARSTQDKT